MFQHQRSLNRITLGSLRVTRGPLLAAAFALFGTGGCATFPNPYPPYPPDPPAATLPGHQRLLDTKDAVIAYQTKLGKSVDEQISSSTLWELGGFVGLLASSITAIFKGPADAVLGLGVAGGSSFTVNSLYFGRGYAQVYQAGREALTCTLGVINTGLEASSKAAAIKPTLDAKVALVIQYLDQSPLPGNPSSDQLATLRTARYDGEQALGQTGLISVAESTIADNVDVTMRAIADTMIHQIDARRPDQAAFTAAVTSLANGNVANLGHAQTQPATQPAKAGQPAAAHGVSNVIQLDDAIAAAKIIEFVIPDLDQIVNGFRKSMLDNLAKCRVDTSSLPAVTTPLRLNVDGNRISLKAGDSKTIPVSGGVLNYAAMWVGSAPTDVSFSLQNNHLSVTASKPLEAGKSYTLRVSDSATPSNSTVDLTVSTTADTPVTNPVGALLLKSGESSTVTLKSGDSRTIGIVGATLDYTAAWVGTAPGDVTFTAGKDGVTLQAKTPLAAPKTYQLTIRDSAKPSNATITVTIKTAK